MKTKTTTRTNGIADPAEFVEVVNKCCMNLVQLKATQASLDEALQKVRDQYEPEIKSLKSKITAGEKEAAVYASLHKDQVLKDKLRHGTTAMGTYGFRLGNPTLSLVSRKFTWGDVVYAIKARGEAMTQYLIHAEPKPNKEALKEGLSADELADLQLQVTQTDSFYIEPFDQSEKQ